MSINHFAIFQSALFSFRNDALFIGGRKAVKQQLVPLIANASQQLNEQVVDAVSRGSFAYAERVAEDIQTLDLAIKELSLRKDVAYYIARETPTRG